MASVPEFSTQRRLIFWFPGQRRTWWKCLPAILPSSPTSSRTLFAHRKVASPHPREWGSASCLTKTSWTNTEFSKRMSHGDKAIQKQDAERGRPTHHREHGVHFLSHDLFGGRPIIYEVQKLAHEINIVKLTETKDENRTKRN